MPTKDFLANAKPVQNDFLADAKPVSQNGGGQAAPPIPTIAQKFQTAFDQLSNAPKFDMHHPISTGANDFGAGVLGLMSPIFHPSATLDAAQKLAMGSTSDKMSVLRPIGKAFMRDPVGQGIAAIPGIASAFAGGDAESAAKATGEATERGGLSLGNAALGARGPKPFKWGANPARGAFEEGVLPAWSKHGAAMKLENVLPPAGQRISDAVMHGGNAPLADMRQSIEGPTNEARSIVEGPGGGNRSIDPINALVSSMEKKAPGASAPIYGPNAGTPYTAEEAMAHIGQKPRLSLPVPKEDIPLHKAGGAEGRLSQPVRLTQLDRPTRPALMPPSLSTPMAPGMQDEFPDRLASSDTGIRPLESSPHLGMGASQYIGQIPGEPGGPPQVQGVLRRPMQFPESAAPSGLADLKHPHASAGDLWKTIQNIDKNTRFNPDPEVEGVNELRREMRGGLRKNLEGAVPGLEGMSQRYGDLKSAQDVLDRTLHSSSGLSQLAKVPMFPIEGAAGKTMYRAGQGLARSAPLARLAFQSAPVGRFLNYIRTKEK